jgi:four helix bundle protein
MKKESFDLENRLIDFSVIVLALAEQLPKTFVGQHLGDQLARSCTSPALNYGEAQAAQSRKDFIHKMTISLKELKETRVCLKIIAAKSLLSAKVIENVLKENETLIAIFGKSISTAYKNLAK